MSEIILKHGPGIPKKTGQTILSEGEPGWSTDLSKLYVGTSNPQAPSLVGKSDFHVNVRDHGAKGDGVTDDGPAVKAAAAEAIRRNTVLFWPSGDYKLKTAIGGGGSGISPDPTDAHDLRWTGEDVYTTKIDIGQNAGYVWKYDATAIARVELSNLQLSSSAFYGNELVKPHRPLHRPGTPVQPRIRIDIAIDHCILLDRAAPQGTNVHAKHSKFSRTISAENDSKYEHCTFVSGLHSSGAEGNYQFIACTIDADPRAHQPGITMGIGVTYFLACRFKMSATNPSAFEYDRGLLKIIDCIVELPQPHAANFAVVKKGTTWDTRRDTRIDYDCTVIAKTADWKHFDLTLSSTEKLNNGIRVVTGNAKSFTNISDPTHDTSVYEHHTDGIWWNGTKITP